MLTSLFVVFVGVELTPPAEATPPPSETPVVRLDGLPALAIPPGGGGATGGLAAQHAEGGAGGRVSAPTRTPITFSMVGFEVADASTEVAFRTSPDGITWSAWAHAHVHADEGPDDERPGADPTAPGDARAASGHHTEPVWVGDVRHLQIRVEDGATEDVAVELVDATGANRSAGARAADAVRAAFRVTGDTARADRAGQPPIVSREEWGADESLRRRDPSYADEVRFGVVHHTAGSNDYSAAQAPAVVRGIYAYHVKSRGWNDIGYQFLVDRFGTIYEGRYGGISKAVIGAHAGGFNTGSFGVSLMGDYTSRAPEPKQVEALAALLAWKFDVHGIDPQDSEKHTSGGSSRYAAGTSVRLENLSGHRDMSLTSCPGGAYGLLPGLRDAIFDRIGDGGGGEDHGEDDDDDRDRDDDDRDDDRETVALG